jgi:hypothetical protein
MSAECFTRPQYVLRSYWETGRSRFPGRDEVMVCVKRGGRGRESPRAHISLLDLGELVWLNTVSGTISEGGRCDGVGRIHVHTISDKLVKLEVCSRSTEKAGNTTRS